MAQYTICDSYDFTDGLLEKSINEAVRLYDRSIVENGADPDSAIVDAVSTSIEDTFMGYVDMLSAVLTYDRAPEAFALVYDDLFAEIEENVRERVGGNTD